MNSHPWMAGFTVLLISLSWQAPCLAFYSIAPEQPRWVEGIPEWRDSVFVRHDTLIVRHLRDRRAYTTLKATLQSLGKEMELRVVEEAGRPDHEGGRPGGLTVKAYEARIGPLPPGTYTLILRDDGYRSALKPFMLRRIVSVTAD